MKATIPAARWKAWLFGRIAAMRQAIKTKPISGKKPAGRSREEPLCPGNPYRESNRNHTKRATSHALPHWWFKSEKIWVVNSFQVIICLFLILLPPNSGTHGFELLFDGLITPI